MKHGAGHVAGERLLLTSTSHEVAALILTVLHVLTFVPLVLLPAMQDAHLKLGIVVNTSLCLCLMMGAGLFQYLGIVKVFPKMLDTFLLALYASMIPVVYMQYSWLSDWVNVYHSGAVATFIWLTILLPCWDSFATEPLKDRLPEATWGLPAVKAAGLRMSVTWGLVMTLCTIAAVPPAVLSERHKRVPMHIICDYVLVLALLALGGAMQWATTVRTLQNVRDPGAPAPQRDLESSGADAQVSVALAVRPEQQQQQQHGRSGCFGGSGSRQPGGCVQPGGSAV